MGFIGDGGGGGYNLHKGVGTEERNKSYYGVNTHLPPPPHLNALEGHMHLPIFWGKGLFWGHSLTKIS